MPTIERNLELWNDQYDWKQQGDEWSSAWGDSWSQWHFSLYPRIARFLPASTILEIAPGFGRWTQYLKVYCEYLVGVDLSSKCVEACRNRFARDKSMKFHVNDGRSLDMVKNETVDFVFSFDSLVHAEADVLEAYLQEIAKKLKPDGVAMIHHSNLGEILAKKKKVNEMHGRASSMSASTFLSFAQAAGLHVISQEIINWGNTPEIDTISIVVRERSPFKGDNIVWRNQMYMHEANYIRQLSNIYSVRSIQPR
jgi:SAM-dependent methyltransferase